MGLVTIELGQGQDAAILEIPELNTWAPAPFSDHRQQFSVSTDCRILLAAIGQRAGSALAATGAAADHQNDQRNQ